MAGPGDLGHAPLAPHGPRRQQLRDALRAWQPLGPEIMAEKWWKNGRKPMKSPYEKYEKWMKFDGKLLDFEWFRWILRIDGWRIGWCWRLLTIFGSICISAVKWKLQMIANTCKNIEIWWTFINTGNCETKHQGVNQRTVIYVVCLSPLFNAAGWPLLWQGDHPLCNSVGSPGEEFRSIIRSVLTPAFKAGNMGGVEYMRSLAAAQGRWQMTLPAPRNCEKSREYRRNTPFAYDCLYIDAID